MKPERARTASDRVFLTIHVVPRASRTRLSREPGGGLRAHLTAAPVDGAANRALVVLLAAALDVPKSAIAVVRGVRAREKLVTVNGVSQADVEARLGRAVASHVDKAKGRE